MVTPWEVSGRIDYDKLTREFGTELLTTELLQSHSCSSRDAAVSHNGRKSHKVLPRRPDACNLDPLVAEIVSQNRLCFVGALSPDVGGI